MALTPTASLSIVSLIVYLILLPLNLLIAFRHGKHGLLAWPVLTIFCVLQLVADGILISTAGHPTFAGAIVTSIGLSPLLVTVLGVLGEIKHVLPTSTTPLSPFNRTSGRLLSIQLHGLIIAGTSLLATGAAQALSNTKTTSTSTSPSPPSSTSLTLWKTGAVLLFISWMLLCFLGVLTLRYYHAHKHSSHVHHSQHEVAALLWAVVCSLPFVGVRTIYSLIYACTRRADLSAVTGGMVVKVVLVFVPQVVAVGLLVGGGLRSGILGAGSRGNGKGTGREGVAMVNRV